MTTSVSQSRPASAASFVQASITGNLVTKQTVNNLGNWLNLSAWTGRSEAPAARRSRTASEFIEQAQSQQGAKYIWGAKPATSNVKPDGFDCSGLVRWAASRAGLSLPEGSMQQLASVKSIPVEQALKTRGALVFYKGDPNHVAISLGNGKVLEATSPWGVTTSSRTSRFTHGGLIPGLKLE